MPSTLTIQERLFVMNLCKNRKPRIAIIDRARLDELSAEFPDIATYFERDPLLEAAKVYNQERALLVDQSDLVARVAALRSQSDTLHPDWRLDFFRTGDIVGTQLVARSPQAAERSPITLNVEVAFNPEQQALQRSMERVLDYGTPGRVVLPASAVTKFAVDGPEFIAQISEHVELSLIPAGNTEPGRASSVSFLDDHGNVDASFPGRTTWTGLAAKGASVRVNFFEVISIEFLIPHDRTEPGAAEHRHRDGRTRPTQCRPRHHPVGTPGDRGELSSWTSRVTCSPSSSLGSTPRESQPPTAMTR